MFLNRLFSQEGPEARSHSVWGYDTQFFSLGRPGSRTDKTFGELKSGRPAPHWVPWSHYATNLVLHMHKAAHWGYYFGVCRYQCSLLRSACLLLEAPPLSQSDSQWLSPVYSPAVPEGWNQVRAPRKWPTIFRGLDVTKGSGETSLCDTVWLGGSQLWSLWCRAYLGLASRVLGFPHWRLVCEFLLIGSKIRTDLCCHLGDITFCIYWREKSWNIFIKN